MKPLRLGLIAAVAIGMLAPVAVYSQAKTAGVDEKARTRGMAEAPAVAQAAGVTCQVADARFIGEVADKKAKTKSTYYEVDCSEGLGFVLQSTAGVAKPSAFTCIEASAPAADGKPSALACALPGNQNSTADVAALAKKAGVGCAVEKVRAVGQTTDKSLFEVLCQGGSGYIVTAANPPIASATAEAASCLLYDEANTNISCTLADKATRLAMVDTLAKQAAASCVVKDRRFVLMTKQNDAYFEVSCQDGKGYMIKADAAGRGTGIECAKAQHVGGGCTLTDARAAATEQAGLYTRLAKSAGHNCEVTQYGALPSGAGKDVVELVCANGPGGIGVFEAGGKGTVYNCAHALVAGYRCSLNKGDTGASALTADLKKLGKGSCAVKDSRLVGKTANGSAYIEVNCSDGLAGYMIEYVAATVTPKEAIGCAFAKGVGGGCKLPGNT
ncbi:hypothetical protein [Phenylobacterium sp.]|jgi:hypothetical protein|uniref:hypothetical protein n=1 Tax=Phenylobacterium sp. TaxID=1871053 RepID=UPI002E2F6B59|nr:hypothetical protein [Phenylobacterium sp.]HEX2560579.1 hypothetical protein [Phenylobacterium sp.]